MRGLAQEKYETSLRRAEDRLGVDLDWQHYEQVAQLDLNGRDLLTPATAVSVAGLALVLDGIQDLSKVNNIHKIGLGRGCDILDGSLARWMNQSSDAGAALDVIFDKYEMWRIGKAAWQQDAMPKSFIGYNVAKNALHAGLTIGAAYQHPNESFRPPRSGKLSMFGDNFAGGAFLYANAYEQEYPELNYHPYLRQIGRAGVLGSAVAEATALPTYIRRTKDDYDISNGTIRERLQQRVEKLAA